MVGLCGVFIMVGERCGSCILWILIDNYDSWDFLLNGVVKGKYYWMIFCGYIFCFFDEY